MICIRWWELILALAAGEVISRLLQVRKRGAQLADWVFRRALHDGPEPPQCFFWRSANQCTHPNGHEGSHSFEHARPDGVERDA